MNERKRKLEGELKQNDLPLHHYGKIYKYETTIIITPFHANICITNPQLQNLPHCLFLIDTMLLITGYDVTPYL